MLIAIDTSAGTSVAVVDRDAGVLAERGIPIASLRAMASSRSAGTEVTCGEHTVTVEDLATADPTGLDGEKNAQLVIPQLFEDFFPSWFTGVAFAAIAIGALVPAAIMSIAAANTFSRNIYKEWIRKDATPAQEAKVSKLMSLVVKAFALIFSSVGATSSSAPVSARRAGRPT